VPDPAIGLDYASGGRDGLEIALGDVFVLVFPTDFHMPSPPPTVTQRDDVAGASDDLAEVA